MSRKKEANSSLSTTRGSDTNRSEPRFLAIGQITKPHGVRGEVSVFVLTDFVERFDTMETVCVGDEAAVTLYTLESVRWHNDRVLIHFAGVSDRTAAEKLRGLYLQVPLEEAIPLESDVYYQHQLIGLRVITDEGAMLGTLTEILETGANDVYVVKGEHKEVLLPATKEVILTVDLAARQMVVHLIAGL